jgi:hypothetical protein
VAGGTGREGSSAGIERRPGAGKHRQVPGKPLEGSVRAIVAWTWLPTMTQSSTEERFGRRTRRGLGVGSASELAGQTKRV